MVEMRWKDKTESLETKRDRLYAELQKHAKADVTLIGESAGGAMVVYAMYLYPNLVHRLITVAGYNRGNESLNPKYSRAHPTFSRLSQLAESANQAFTSSQRSKITTIVSPLDRVVPERYSYIKDARVIRLSTNGHMGTIRYILTHTLKNIL
jgi:pimeloyl-ACP methyl ester carboxylesterase